LSVRVNGFDCMPVSGVDESFPIGTKTSLGRVAWIEAEPVGGAKDEGDATALVLVHGFTGHRDDFIGVLPELAQLGNGRRVIAPDLRGHGDSDGKSGDLGWTFEQLVRDLLAFLDELGLDRVDLLGHSMGGFVVLRFALAHPERVRSLVFLCTGPETPASLPRDGFLKAAELADSRGIGGIGGLQEILEKVGRIEPSPTIDSWGERYWTHHRRRFGAMTPSSYRGLGTAFFDADSMLSRLHEIDQPTLVLVGESDVDWLPGADLFERALPNVNRVTLANAEHHPHIENTRAFLAAVEAHLGALDEAE
jgi:pimeloyl-ACP methyl ester carboxylesterase